MPPVVPSPDWYPTRRRPAASVPRLLLHLAVLGFSCFLLVRTVALEPFGVPTGSMAPTLLGLHRSAPCPRCGHPVRVGEPGPEARAVAWGRCRCPNCGLAVDLADARAVPGDRVLVDKTAFEYRPPRRWEVAVFDCPADRSKPYVKRLVGLPGERIQISDGDVYADGELLRKSLPQVRELLVPVFDMGYAPEGGWGPRWVLENAELTDDGIRFGAAKPPTSATYRNWNLDAGREEPVEGWLAYNGGPAERRGSFAKASRGDAAHDFYVSFVLSAAAVNGMVVSLSDGADTVEACLTSSDSLLPAVVRVRTPDGRLETRGELRLTAGRYRVEFALVDRRASLAVDGVEVVPPLDLPADRPGSARRQGASRPLDFRSHAMPATVSEVRLFRDVHYLPFGATPSGVRVGPAEYFALGDNTANSHDSRTWQIDGRPAPGVPAAGLVGKPFLVHQPLRLARSPLGGPVQTLDWDRLRLLR